MHHRSSLAGAIGACLIAAVAPATSAENPVSGSAAGGVTLSTSPGGELVTGEKKPALDLSDAQREAVIAEIIRRNTHQATPKEFKPELGTAVTRFVNIHAMPPGLHREIPRLAQYMYAHLDRVIVIVNALDSKMVALIPLPENLARDSKADQKGAAAAAVGGVGELSPAQKLAIYQSASGEPQPVPQQAFLAGADVPQGLTFQPLDPSSVAQAPQLQNLHYSKLQDGRLVLVDPEKRKVAGIITRDEGTGSASDKAATTGAGQNRGVSGEPTSDPLRAREESGKPSAYTGPTTTGPNTD